MIKIIKNYVLVAIINLLMISAAFANISPYDDLKVILDKIKTFRAEFKQEIYDDVGEKVSVNRGFLKVQRPGKFLWEIKSPDSIKVIADGINLWTYDVELEQVTKQNLQEVLGNTPASILAGDTSNLAKEFKIVYTVNCNKYFDDCFLLTPKSQDAPFSSILIGVKKSILIYMKVIDPLGQKVITRFTKVNLNSNIDNSFFTFVPPKGVDVIQSGS